jgi:dihydroorotate dehydrogenase electron transfer subunit
MQVRAEVLGVEPRARRRVVCLRLHAPTVARLARPGQFVMLACGPDDQLDPFLMRPFSIYRVPDPDSLELLLAVVGRGTARLAEQRPGAQLRLLGPIGQGFGPPDEGPVLAVGGGLGVAPLVFLVERLRARSPDRPVLLLCGAPTAEALVSLPDLGIEVRLATDDGTAGRPGLVTELMEQALEALPPEARPGAYAAACGPEGMLRRVAQIARARGLAAEVSLEAHMACGTGACLGCARPVGQGSRRVCVDGPVFAAGEVYP